MQSLLDTFAITRDADYMETQIKGIVNCQKRLNEVSPKQPTAARNKYGGARKERPFETIFGYTIKVLLDDGIRVAEFHLEAVKLRVSIKWTSIVSYTRKISYQNAKRNKWWSQGILCIG